MIRAQLIGAIALAALLCPPTRAADYLNLSTLTSQLQEIANKAPKAGEITSSFFPSTQQAKSLELPKTKSELQTSKIKPNSTAPAETTDKTSLPATAVEGKLTTAKGETLAWFAKFAKDESLFRFSDLNEMQRKLMSMSDDELKRWLSETKYVRDALNSDEWAATGEWLSQFWKRQAMYKDKELDAFRSQLKQLPPDGLLFVMDHFANQYISKTNRLAFKQSRRGGIGVNPDSRAISQRPTSGAGANYANASAPTAARPARQVITQDHLSTRVSRYYMYRGYNNYFWAYRPLPR